MSFDVAYIYIFFNWCVMLSFVVACLMTVRVLEHSCAWQDGIYGFMNLPDAPRCGRGWVQPTRVPAGRQVVRGTMEAALAEFNPHTPPKPPWASVQVLPWTSSLSQCGELQPPSPFLNPAEIHLHSSPRTLTSAWPGRCIRPALCTLSHQDWVCIPSFLHIQ